VKALLFALLATVSVAAHAASPTETYLATREKAAADLAHGVGTPEPADSDRIEADALRELGRLVRDVVGDIGVRGFPAEGESNVISLADGYMDSGHVDGLRAMSGDGVAVLVTTVELVQGWLKLQGPGLAIPGQELPDSVGKLLGNAGFYTQAFFRDSAVNFYAEIPVATAGEGSSVRAFLFRRSQDSVAPSPPDGLIVSVVRGARITIFDKPLDAAGMEIPVCKTAWEDAQVGVQLMFAAARRASDMQGAVLRAQAMADQAQDAFLKCYGERLLQQVTYPGLVGQARELVGRVGPGAD
jgi:hypothetical protein